MQDQAEFPGNDRKDFEMATVILGNLYLPLFFVHPKKEQ